MLSVLKFVDISVWSIATYVYYATWKEMFSLSNTSFLIVSYLVSK